MLQIVQVVKAKGTEDEIGCFFFEVLSNDETFHWNPQ